MKRENCMDREMRRLRILHAGMKFQDHIFFSVCMQ